MSTPRYLPAGPRPWLVTSRAGVRLVLVAPGGPVAALPLGATAEPLSDLEADAFTLAAPKRARWWWRFAAAAGWAVELWCIPNPHHAGVTDAWVLDVHDRGAGLVQRHAWVRASGDRWEPVPPSEYARPGWGERPVLAERGVSGTRAACEQVSPADGAGFDTASFPPGAADADVAGHDERAGAGADVPVGAGTGPGPGCGADG